MLDLAEDTKKIIIIDEYGEPIMTFKPDVNRYDIMRAFEAGFVRGVSNGRNEIREQLKRILGGTDERF